MPAILERLVSQLKAKKVKNPYAVATAQLEKFGIIDRHGELTKYGAKRDSMTPAERAKDRAAKYSGKRKPSDYSYNKRTNIATVR